MEKSEKHDFLKHKMNKILKGLEKLKKTTKMKPVSAF
jgi:hypothetical protein